MSVTITVKSVHKEVSGKVIEVSGSAKNTGGQYLVKVMLTTTDKTILSGMFVNVQFPVSNRVESGTSTEKVMVPESALIQQGQLTGIYTIGSSNTAILRWVRTGKKFGDQVEILSGLTANEQYIVTSEGKLFNGAKIQIK
jgi:hypothetical protein